MTDKSDKPVGKKDPLKNLQADTSENVLLNDWNKVPGALKMKKGANDLNKAIKTIIEGCQETKDFLYNKYGYEVASAFYNEMERQGFNDIIPSFDHKDTSRLKNMIDESFSGAKKKFQDIDICTRNS